jgi:hypothetical protein
VPLSYGTQRHWEQRADEARALADEMQDPEAKRILLSIAQSHDSMAKFAEAHELHVPIARPQRRRRLSGARRDSRGGERPQPRDGARPISMGP